MKKSIAVLSGLFVLTSLFLLMLLSDQTAEKVKEEISTGNDALPQKKLDETEIFQPKSESKSINIANDMQAISRILASEKSSALEFSKIAEPIKKVIDRLELNGESAIGGSFGRFVRVDDSGRIQLYLRLVDMDAEKIARLERSGFEIEIINENMNMVQGWMDHKRISGLSLLSNVQQILPPHYGESRRGSRMTEGDTILLADRLRSLGYFGEGVRIGIISDGGDNVQDAIASGDLPSFVRTYGSCSRRNANRSQCLGEITCNEGTAMAEIIHDIAPEAELAIGSGMTSLEFIQRIFDLSVSFNADVIVDDIGFFGQPFFEDGDVAKAVEAVADNLVYVSAAGNSANSHYEAEFDARSNGDSTAHNFSTSGGDDLTMDIQLEPDGYAVAILQWNDQFGLSSNDYDLFLTDSNVTEVLTSSREPQIGFHDPIEAVCYHNNSLSSKTVKLAVQQYDGINRRLEMFVFGRGVTHQYNQPFGSTFGHSAVEAAISVAAINADSPRNVTFYSSRGPARIDYPFRIDRRKPDLAGIDGVSVTGAGGFPTKFFGTSAAAPHIAAVAGLLLSAAPGSSPREIKSALMDTAVDVEAFGIDALSGAGRVDALASFEYLEVPIDSDFDGIEDSLDNCVAIANSQQLDTDRDGSGNACDADDDDDGVLDEEDAFPNDADETTDTDGDGIGNNVDRDDDGDGVEDSADEFPLDPSRVSSGRAVSNDFTGMIYLQTTSTSKNISFSHILNVSDVAQRFVGNLYGSDGQKVGLADQALHLGQIAPKGRLILASTDLESIFRTDPWSGPAMLEVSGTSAFDLMTKLTSPSGLISNTNCVRKERVHNISGFDESDLSYVRFINVGLEAISGIRGSLFNDRGDVIGEVNPIIVDLLPAKAHVWRNRDQLSDIVAETWNGTVSLEIKTPHPDLRLLNLNLINNETFFNFSCYESGQ